ncbi:MAG: mechanosensitive ion channel [Candidatus Aenigmarchaeota archaeon]|nr:mechanosensitive ion channel [Candidatus Aenigmarchaeota archaeon]
MVDTTIFIGNVSLADFLLFIFLFIVTILISNVISELIKGFLKGKLKGSRYKIPARVVQYILVFLVTYYGLSNILGFDFRAFFAAFGIMGIVIAFSAQQTIQNVIGGLFILLGDLFRLDDWIETSGLPSTDLAQVKDIGLTRTTLREVSGSIVTLPNSVFISNKLVKYPRGDFFRAFFSLKVSPKAKVEKVKEVIDEICSKNEKILPNIPRREKRGLRKLLLTLPGGHEQLLGFLDRKLDVKRFEPEVLIKEISKDSLTVEVFVWIWEIENKQRIISNLLDQIRLDLPKKGIKLV